MAPFVSPVVAGKPMAERGKVVKTFTPAYIKPKTALDSMAPLTRVVGEKVGGTLSPMQRREAQLASVLMDHIDSITRRLEWMAVQGMRSGSVTITGDEYPSVSVSFGRDAALTVVKGGGAKWGDTGVSILEDLEDWSNLMLQKSGRPGVDVIMPVDVWKVVKADAEIKQRLDTRNITGNAMSTASVPQVGGVFKGSVDAFNFFVYADWYEDSNGVEQPMLPQTEVVMTSQAVEGVQAFGAILDDAAGYQSMRYFPKSWVPEDPAIRQVLTQSAPLIVPTNINNTLGATVL